MLEKEEDILATKICNQFKIGKDKHNWKDQTDDAELGALQDTVGHFGCQGTLLLISLTKSLLLIISLKWTPPILTYHLTLVTWKETEKKYNCQSILFSVEM